ncbi:MAG: diguanylate cyclase [Marmoricola sp.]|nr:diguanylate cyclase [Marmoricola sp.]
MSAAYELERLETLRTLEVLDTPPEAEFDAIITGARHLFDCRMAFVSLVDADRQWFKARCGLDASETPRDISICNHTIVANDLLVVPDTLLDARFANNPLIVGVPFIRFYAGIPLRIARHRGGTPMPVGTLCVADDRPHDPSPEKLEMLRGMGHVIEALLEARRSSTESLRLALERHDALMESERTQRLLQHAERMARIGSWRLDLATEHAHWSAQTYAIHGLVAGDATALEAALDFYPPPDRERLETALAGCIGRGEAWDLELDFIDATGDLRRIRTIGEPELRDGVPVAVIGVIQDITERYKFERRLHDVAHTDELTGLASRRAFNERLDTAIAESLATGSPLAVAILDLDRFKEVNDRLGHAAGDEVLRLMAATLRGITYFGEHFAARLGGDEFVLLLHGPHARERLATGLGRLLADLCHQVPADGGSIAVSATIGVCAIDAAHDNRSALLKAADQSLYRAKRLRRGTAAITGRAAIVEAVPAGLPITRTA